MKQQLQRNNMKKTLIIIGVIVLVVLGYGVFTYNSLVTLSTSADAQWKQVEVEYQRRFDLIPNLVESVKGVMTQEQKVFSALAEARTRYTGATTPSEKARAASSVESALGRLLVVTENYPTLKSSDAVQSLMISLEGSENRVSVERSRYNDVVRSYNLKVSKVPSSLVARMFHFAKRSYFNSAPAAKEAPKVNLK